MNKILGRIGLSLKFSLMVFSILFLAATISAGLMHIAIKLGIFSENIIESNGLIPIFTLIACIIIGTILSILASKSTIKSVEQFVVATNQLAGGDFTARLDIKAPEEFKVIAQNFNYMAKELGSIEMLRSDFINDFSHEFKTPIVSIKGFAEILKYDDLSPEERKEYLDIIIEEASRLAALSSSILELSKIEHQEILTHKQEFNLGEQIRQSLLLLDSKINQKHIHLELDIYDYNISGNKEMLSQVWVNLVDNAVKFTPDGGWIYISMGRDEKQITVEIRDTGCGIREADVTRIFDKFYQADSSHATYGNGLGLSMVKKIIELHGGTINCQSIVSSGTHFGIMLPVSQQSNKD